MTFDALRLHAKNIRRNCLNMAYKCGDNTHLGGGLSEVEVLAVLYGQIMNTRDKNLSYSDRDKFILSKGHGVLGFYATLHEFGIISRAILDSFMQDGSDLLAHPVMNPGIGIESSSGSLGQGISMAVGLALAAKKKAYGYQTFVLCGNGECNEGSVWEAVMSAVQFELDNFTLTIDNNMMQSDGESLQIMNASSHYTDMLQSVGFQVIDVDGHDVAELVSAYVEPHENGKPKAIVAHTTKGKGVSFMENDNAWHHNRLTQKQYEAAILELEGSVC